MCGVIKAKAKPMSKKSDRSKKAIEVGERLVVDTTKSFVLTTTK